MNLQIVDYNPDLDNAGIACGGFAFNIQHRNWDNLIGVVKQRYPTEVPYYEAIKRYILVNNIPPTKAEWLASQMVLFEDGTIASFTRKAWEEILECAHNVEDF